MRGLSIEGGRVTYSEDLPEPAPRDGEVTVSVVRAGVCATDLALCRGYMDFNGVPGHEFVGVAQDGPLAGRRVVGEINAACGTCNACRAGQDRHCPSRTVLGILRRPGAFAERLALPARNLHAVPDAVSTDAATFVEPLAAALQIEAQVALDAVGAALVAGDGRLGLLCAHVLSRHDIDVTVAGRHPERAELLPAGARHITGLLEDGPPDPTFDLAIEATGHPDVLGRLLFAVRPRGTIVLKTTSEAPAPLDLSPLVVNEQVLVGSRCGRFEPALAALANGDIPVERFVHDRFDLRQGARALERAAEPGVLKVLIDIAQSQP